MSQLVTVSELQERVRVDCGLPVYTADTNISTTTILEFVKRAAQKLQGLIQQYRADEQYLTLSTTLTTVADVPVVSLPSNCQDLVRVSMEIDNDREIQLSPAPLEMWDPNQYFWDVNAVPMYRVIGNTITLFPTPTSARTLNVYYTVGFTVTATSDILALRPNWDEYIVQWCNIFVRNRQEKASPEFRDALSIAQQEIVGQLRRDRAGPRQARDLRGDVWNGYRNGRRWPW
jgi:hypothetical protein